MKKSDYRFLREEQVRWEDNDMFGHVNNVKYYSYFDSAVNNFQMAVGGWDPIKGDVRFYVATNQCDYYQSLKFPQSLEVGVAIQKLGNSSITYNISIFADGSDDPSATATAVYVTVDSKTEKPMPIPETLRDAFSAHQI